MPTYRITATFERQVTGVASVEASDEGEAEQIALGFLADQFEFFDEGPLDFVSIDDVEEE